MRRLIEHLLARPSVYAAYQAIVRRGQTIEHALQAEVGSPSGVILDFACGSGMYAFLFSRTSYVGVDMSSQYLGFARRKNPGYRFGVMDVRHLGLRSASVTRIVAVGLLHHLTDDEAVQALREARSALTTDGAMVIIDLLPAASAYNLLGRILVGLDRGQYPRTRSRYRRLFEKAFVVIKDYAIRSGPYDLGVFVIRPA